jgi:excisionase family DNA binding protein
MRPADLIQSELEATTESHLIGVHALAERLGVSQRFVRRLVAERRVPFLKIGKFVRFDPTEIDEWVETCRVPQL